MNRPVYIYIVYIFKKILFKIYDIILYIIFLCEENFEIIFVSSCTLVIKRSLPDSIGERSNEVKNSNMR